MMDQICVICVSFVILRYDVRFFLDLRSRFVLRFLSVPFDLVKFIANSSFLLLVSVKCCRFDLEESCVCALLFISIFQTIARKHLRLEHMHGLDTPYAHNDVKPGNVLITHRKGQPPLAILMDFGSARPARKHIGSRSEALQLQEWAAEHSSAPFRAPELWECPSQGDIDERTDVWSLGCTLYAIMYGVSPFEYALDEPDGDLRSAVLNAKIKWPTERKSQYPDALHQFVSWMLQPQIAVRPRIDDIVIHVDKLIAKFSG
ncbi:hypothetical protein AHAS_Ahas11G0253000 [Arachis hypogaea]